MSNLFESPGMAFTLLRFFSAGLLALTGSVLLTGCASMVNGSQQSLQIEAVDATSGATKSANCHVSKPGLNIRVKSTESFKVDRGSDDLLVACEDGELSGHLKQESDFAKRYLLLDIATDFCIVSCFVDGHKKAWYEYPSPIVVPMSVEP